MLLMDQSCEGDEFVKYSYFKPTYKFSDRLIYQIVEYSRSRPPFILNHREQQEGNKGKHNVSPLILGMRGWEIPNLFVMYQAFKIHNSMKKRFE